MMGFELRKTFSFSASYELESKLHANNFNLTLCARKIDLDSEQRLTELVQELFISKVHTTHLNKVDIFSNIKIINEYEILRVFWFKLALFLKEFNIDSILLQKDSLTTFVFYPDKVK